MERISTVCTICQELVVERAFLLLSILLIYCFKLLGCEMMFKDNAEGVLSQPALSVSLKIPFQGHISRIVKLEIFTQTCNHEIIKLRGCCDQHPHFVRNHVSSGNILSQLNEMMIIFKFYSLSSGLQSISYPWIEVQRVSCKLHVFYKQGVIWE
ncbi:hypothetical protein T02_9278 [Trichinella nativa]|uniref:Uncharacterized protein n=1 Tax=Trichinella nativa TaxID=6335 RepID=A0A0V1LJZ9_9BILA|nr:hypothetical protein T02_9278 [Trichinella nativa]